MWRWAIVLACCAVAAFAAYTTLANVSSRDVCGAVNRNAVVLRHIIMDSARDSRRYGDIKLGDFTSTYADRLATARRQAAQIQGCP